MHKNSQYLYIKIKNILDNATYWKNPTIGFRYSKKTFFPVLIQWIGNLRY